MPPKCRFCNTELTSENWPSYSQKVKRYRCRDCQNAIQRKRRDTDEERRKANLRMRKYYKEVVSSEKKRAWGRQKVLQKYGITAEQYDRLYQEQNGLCAICKSDKPKGTSYSAKHFHIDHDHTTNEVRGLLCMQCNMALGLLKDDFNRLLSMVAYLMDRRGIENLKVDQIHIPDLVK